MGLYIKAKIMKKYQKLMFAWLPIAVVEFENCLLDEKFIIDCCISGIIKSPLARLLLIKKLPKKTELSLVPSIDALKFDRNECSPKIFIQDLENLWLATKSNEPYSEKSWAEVFEPSRWVLSRILSPSKWILGKMENLPMSISADISRSLVKGMLKQLCIDKGLQIRSWTKAFMLIGIDAQKNKVYIFLGDKVIRSEAHERYIFRNPDVENVFRSKLRYL